MTEQNVIEFPFLFLSKKKKKRLMDEILKGQVKFQADKDADH